VKSAYDGFTPFEICCMMGLLEMLSLPLAILRFAAHALKIERDWSFVEWMRNNSWAGVQHEPLYLRP
jgi:hypothetical protein